jgi:hypothetical protein
VEQEGDHRAGILTGSALRDQQLAHWSSLLRKSGPKLPIFMVQGAACPSPFWRGTGARTSPPRPRCRPRAHRRSVARWPRCGRRSVAEYRSPRAGTIQNVRILVRSNGLNASSVVTLTVNGAGTPISAVIPAGSTVPIDIPGTFAVADGDRIAPRTPLHGVRHGAGRAISERSGQTRVATARPA